MSEDFWLNLQLRWDIYLGMLEKEVPHFKNIRIGVNCTVET